MANLLSESEMSEPYVRPLHAIGRHVSLQAVMLAALSGLLLAAYLSADILWLRSGQIPADRLAVADLSVKLCLVASFLSFCLFVVEVRGLTLKAARGRRPKRSDLLGGLIPEPILASDVDTCLSAASGGLMLLVSFERMSEVIADAAVRATSEREMFVRVVEQARNGVQAAAISQTRFALLISSVGEDERAQIVTTVLESFCRPVHFGSRAIAPSFFIGAVSLGASGFRNSAEAFRAARIALRAAEERDTGWAIEYYSPDLDVSVSDHEVLALRLPKAIFEGEIEVYLQPKVTLDTGVVCGFEAFARWALDERVVEAKDIVKVAEQAGVLVDLDRLVVEEAICSISTWNRLRRTDFTLSVNVSREHFCAPHDVAFILDALEKHDFPPEKLTIEITQTSLLGKESLSKPSLERLRSKGCRLSIDDFGCGQSTLADIRNLPADEIKIDRLLLQDLGGSSDGRVLLRSLLRMADDMRIDAVVEGVERAEEAHVLRQLGFECAQGFFFGHPRPAAECLADATFGPTRQAALGDVRC